MPLRDGLLLAYFIGSLPVCFFRPFYGIALWVVVSFLNPQSFIWSYGATFPWALSIGLATLAGFGLWEFNLRGLKSREAGLILLLWTWFIITSIASTSS